MRLLKWAVVIFLLYFSIGFLYDRYGRVGFASWYGDGFKGEKTASGEVYDPDKLTAAHRRLTFGTLLKVTNLSNRCQVIVRINDRGPHKRGRIIDLSRAASMKLGMSKNGVTKVRIEVVSK